MSKRSPVQVRVAEQPIDDLHHRPDAGEVHIRASGDQPFVQQSCPVHAASSDPTTCVATAIRSRGSVHVDPYRLVSPSFLT